MKKRLKIWADKEIIMAMYVNGGLSYQEIARIYHCSAQTICNIMKTTHIEPRRVDIKSTRQRGPLHPSWKGGRKRTTEGYIDIYSPNHPRKDKMGYVREHRLVMEHQLGRFLTRKEQVHHINGIRDDNRPENLELISAANHRLRATLCAQCPMRKEIRLLKWQIRELLKQSQGHLIE